MDWTKLKDDGNVLLKDGNIDGAIEKYSAALELAKDDVEAAQILYSNRSAAYLKKGNHEKALADADSCVQIAPKWSKGYSRKSAVLRELKKFEAASAVAQEGLKLEPSSVALNTLHKACETSLVCEKLRGEWHGRVAEEVGGYIQSFDFWSDSDVRVMVLGTTVEAKYDLDVFAKPFPHLDMSVPGSPGQAYVRHIYRFPSNDEVELCSPYLRPPDERPTDFGGPGTVIMKRGPFLLSAEEQQARAAMLSRPVGERVVIFLEECIAALPSSDVRPREGESDAVIGEKLTANVKFQTFYQSLIEKMGQDAEQHVKELIVGLRPIEGEPAKVIELVKRFADGMKQAGLIGEDDEAQQQQQSASSGSSVNPMVGTAPQEVLESKEAMARFVSGADEPLADIDPAILPPPKQEEEAAPKPVKKAVPRTAPSAAAESATDMTPVLIGAAIVTACLAVAAAAWFGSRNSKD